MKCRLLLKLGENRCDFYGTATAASVHGDKCQCPSFGHPQLCQVRLITEMHFYKENVTDLFLLCAVMLLKTIVTLN